MEIRDISNIYELKNYIVNTNEDNFLNALRSEQKKHEHEDYKLYRNMWLEWTKKKHGLIRYLIYRNWFLARFPMHILHRLRHINNPVLFYDRRAFYLQYKELGYCRIDDCIISSFDETARNIYKNIDNYIKIYERLADKRSQNVLFGVLKCRLSRNIDFIVNVSDTESLQYFDDTVTGKLNQEVFADIGGYIGDTSEILLNKCNTVDKIYLYEPNTENLKIAKQVLGKYSEHSNTKLELRSVGVSNIESEVKLSKNESGSRVIHNSDPNSDTSMDTISLVTLDNDIKDKLTFIKMDIEGEEANALEGAQKHIADDKPKLAISVYHKIDDLWQIPMQINNYYSGYKMFLRHYNKMRLTETVLYCIPR